MSMPKLQPARSRPPTTSLLQVKLLTLNIDEINGETPPSSDGSDRRSFGLRDRTETVTVHRLTENLETKGIDLTKVRTTELHGSLVGTPYVFST